MGAGRHRCAVMHRMWGRPRRLVIALVVLVSGYAGRPGTDGGTVAVREVRPADVQIPRRRRVS
jgi:hypothetical protein